jgi:hypothetical protein
MIRSVFGLTLFFSLFAGIYFAAALAHLSQLRASILGLALASSLGDKTAQAVELSG